MMASIIAIYVCAACSVRRVWEVLHVLVFCYGTSAFCDMILCCIEVLHYDGPFGCSGLLIWRLVSSVVDTCHVTMSCSVLTRAGRAYACLRMYAFDRDGGPCWPAGTRHLCNDGSWKPTDNVISELTVNGFTIWCLNSLHKYWHYRTCRSFVSFLADTMNLQYSYSTAKRTRDFFEMIVRYTNDLLLLLLKC